MEKRGSVLSLVVVGGLLLSSACGSDSPAEVSTGGVLASGGFAATGGVTAGTGGSLIAASGGETALTGGAVTGTGAVTASTGGAITGSGGADASVGTGGEDAGLGTGGTGGDDTNSAQMLPAVTDYAQPGPFSTTTTEANVGPNNGYTVVRPDPLGENGFLHSPIIFGPGIATSPTMYSAFFDHLASHGFVIVSVNALSGSPGAQANLDAMKAGLEWIIAQNSVAGPYQDKIAVDRAVGMGYSLGATASVQLSAEAAIMTTVAIHGHNTSGDPHGPVLLLTGTSDVIDDVRATMSTLTEAPVILAALPIGHLNVLTELAMNSTITSSARYIAPITAWLRYWVNGDDNAKHFFWGSTCDMCSDPWIAPETNALWDAQSL